MRIKICSCGSASSPTNTPSFGCTFSVTKIIGFGFWISAHLTCNLLFCPSALSQHHWKQFWFYQCQILFKTKWDYSTRFKFCLARHWFWHLVRHQHWVSQNLAIAGVTVIAPLSLVQRSIANLSCAMCMWRQPIQYLSQHQCTGHWIQLVICKVLNIFSTDADVHFLFPLLPTPSFNKALKWMSPLSSNISELMLLLGWIDTRNHVGNER
jgi:hypothetical protein